MILLIDNYDSFVHNLARYIREAGHETYVVRHDRDTVQACLAMAPSAIVLSPGPGRPVNAGICCDLIRAAGTVPLLGVCLGHQCLAEVYGGQVVSSREPMHGRASEVTHDGTGVLKNIPSPFMAGRYHSLSVRLSAGSPLRAQGHTQDGEIMAMHHRNLPHHGVQFHPESLLTDDGRQIMSNFLALAAQGGT